MPHHDPALFDALMREVADRRVIRRDRGDYALFKYNTVQQLSREWTDVRRTARGIVFHVPSAAVVCRPIPKFFNLDEDDETRFENLPAAAPRVEEKVDGSCVSLHLQGGEIRCATPGSFDSEQARWAELELARRGLSRDHGLRGLLAETTLVCEAIFPENVSVVDYADRRDIVLLAAVDLDGRERRPDEVDALAARFALSRPRHFDVGVSRDMSVDPRAEGYVVSYWTGPRPLRVKVKGDEFLRLHPVVTALSDRVVLDLIETGRLEHFAPQMPRAARERTDDIASALLRRFRSLKARVETVHAAAKDLPSRKEQAAFVLGSAGREERPLVFAALDGKLRDADVWATVRRSLAGDRPASGLSPP